MPIYEYRCETCGNRVEVLVRSSGQTPRCPECGSLLADKLFSVPNILSGHTERAAGHTCCGQKERCDRPPCADGDPCCHD
jgi:putative FmdB family regulatory protein